MSQIQKQKVKLTDLLRDTIKDLRKTYNKRGDSLSKELERGASYISQLENGKIKDIEFDLLDTIFQHIVGLSGDSYNDFIKKYIYEIINKATSKESLFDEDWIHIFVLQNFQVVISDNIIDIIKKKLEQECYTPEQLVNEINKNIFQRRWSDITREQNKLYVDIHSSSYDDYYTYTYIRYSLPNDYVTKILSKETPTISFIFMDGILKNLYALNSIDQAGAIKKSKKILFDNGFFDTIELYENLHKLSHQQAPLKVDMPSTNDSDLFTFYDEVIVNYNQKYETLKHQAIEKLTYAFDQYRARNSSYACETLEKILYNMNDDLLGLIMVMLSAPLNSIPRDMRHYFWEDCKELIERYSRQI